LAPAVVVGCDPEASHPPSQVAADLDSLVAALEADTNAALERIANWTNFKRWEQAKKPFVALMITFPESVAQLDTPPEASEAAATLIDRMPWDYDKVRAELDAGVLSAKGLDYSHFEETQGHIAALRAALAAADPCLAATSDPAAPGGETCQPVLPPTLPRGIAELEGAVADLDERLAGLRERAIAEGRTTEGSRAILDDLAALGQDFARTLRQVRFAKQVRADAKRVIGDLVLETEVAVMRLSGTPLDPAPEELGLPEIHAALERFRADLGYELSCGPLPTPEDGAPSP
jgi:hypothetical protein